MSPISSRTATALLLRRQTVTTATDGRQDLDSGAIAGIVIGSIVGVLLIIWIVRSCTANRLGSPPQQQVSSSSSRPRSRSRHSSYSVYPEDDYHHHHHHQRRHHDGHRHHSRRRSSSGRPVVVETRAPAPVYVYDTRRGRSPRGHH
ncbi:hypothetical protein RB595_005776 [Gaeumannomyces hyphopodioides]